jgi:hypothetical protein
MRISLSHDRSEVPMARRTFDAFDVLQVLEHSHAGRPKLVIADGLGPDPETVRKYVASAEAAGIAPDHSCPELGPVRVVTPRRGSRGET